jgi:hypothetical protein
MPNPRPSVRSGGTSVSLSSFEWHEMDQGHRPADRFIRVAGHKGFTRVRPGQLVAQCSADAPATLAGCAFPHLRQLLE